MRILKDDGRITDVCDFCDSDASIMRCTYCDDSVCNNCLETDDSDNKICPGCGVILESSPNESYEDDLY